jgi:D-alanyl-D-alanine carboxypeptidase (penicillin-binding protein 5/6)
MVAPRAFMVTVPRGLGSERKTRVVPVATLTAPIAKGQKVGEYVVSVAGNPDSRFPLVAGAAVAEAGPVLAAWNWLKSLVGM